MKKNLFFVFLLLALTSVVYAQKFPYDLPVPQGWTTETFGLPPTFAKAIPYQGTEDIRFTPGWSDAKSEEYWAYTFVWLAQGVHSLNETKLREYLTAYYTGVYEININAKPKPPAGFTRVTIDRSKGLTADKEAYEGIVNTLNFLTGQPIQLYVRVHLRSYLDYRATAILFEVSPQVYTHAVWKDLESVVKDFKFGK